MPSHLASLISRLAFLVATSLVLFTASAAFGQAPYLVHDINTERPDSVRSSNPRYFFELGGNVLFAAHLGSTVELWITDFTEAGTRRVINRSWPGSVGTTHLFFLGRVGGVAIFTASDPLIGWELWRTDGTEEGTFVLWEMTPGRGYGVFPGGAASLGDALYFPATDESGSELWRTDGTVAGTYRVKDIVEGSGSSSPTGLIAFDGNIFFGANGGLWKSDGTTANTVEVKEGVISHPRAVVGGTLFFYGADATYGGELWATDGTSGGTRLVRDINAGVGHSAAGANHGIVLDGTLLFFANDGVHGTELWSSDGTFAGTIMVKDVWPGSNSSAPGFLRKVGDSAFFTANDGVAGTELWRSDGTPTGTALVRDIKPGASGSLPTFLSAATGRMFFLADDGVTGRELWIVDEAGSGATLVHDIYPGLYGSLDESRFLGTIGNRAILGPLHPLLGAELWTSDGTETGTVLVKNIGGDLAGSSFPTQLTPVESSLYFRTDTPDGRAIWQTDGSSIDQVSWSSDGRALTLGKCGDFLCFNSGGSFFRTDGTEAGTSILMPSSFATPLETGGITYLEVVPESGAHVSLFRLHDNGDLVFLSYMQQLSALPTRGLLFYRLGTGIGVSDGTPAGTGLIREFAVHPSILGESNGNVFFMIGSDTGIQIWRTQGTYESTKPVTTILGSQLSLQSKRGVDANGLFFFVISRGLSHSELWRSDGTEAGTSKVRDFAGTSLSAPSELTNLNGMLMLAADDGESGRELWVSDGTEGGTRILKDILPGPAGSAPSDFHLVQGRVYFQANDGVTGLELWRTDGTPHGTERVYDLVLGEGGSGPENFAHIGETLYFSATTPETGRELWGYTLPRDLNLSATGGTIAEAAGNGSFRISLSEQSNSPVTVRARLFSGTAMSGTDFVSFDEVITFDPGIVIRDLSFVVLNDDQPEADEIVVLELSEPAGARVSSNRAIATILDDDRAADLEIRAEGNGFVVFNHGPSVATDVQVELSASIGVISGGGCGVHCDLSVIPVGEARKIEVILQNEGSTYSATVSSPLRDPVPGNNSATGMKFKGFIVHCGQISTSGTRASIAIGTRFTDERIYLSANPPSAVTMPSSVLIPAHVPVYDVMIHGVTEGPVTITATGRFDAIHGSQWSQTYSISTSVSSAACPIAAGACVPPSLVSQPPSLINAVADRPVQLSLSATGTEQLTYAWYKGEPGSAAFLGDTPTVETSVSYPGSKVYARVFNACGTTITEDIHVNAFRRRPADFRAAGVSQTVVYREGAWVNYSAPQGGVWTGQTSPSCIPAPADYDGDGVAEMAMLCNGAWSFYNPDGTLKKAIWTSHVPGDLPVPADYDGDGDDDVVVYRGGAWRFFDYATGNFIRGVWTAPGPNTIPVPGDYDNDGKADLSVYQGGPWHFYNADGTYLKGIWTGGVAGDIPVPGDYTIDGKDEVVIFRGGAWVFFDFITKAHLRGVWTGAATWKGLPLQPAPLDTDGDGTVEFTVFAGGPWHFFNDNGSYWRGVWTGGVAGDQPISRRQHVNP